MDLHGQSCAPKRKSWYVTMDGSTVLWKACTKLKWWMVLLKAATNPAETLKQHGQPWITEDDLRLLASVQANTVRIPIGYCVFVQAVAVCQRRQRRNWSESWATVENTVCKPLLTSMTDQDHRTQTFTLVEEGTWSFTSTITSFEVSKPFKPQLTGQMRFRSIWNREFLPTNQWTNLT